MELPGSQLADPVAEEEEAPEETGPRQPMMALAKPKEQFHNQAARFLPTAEERC